MTVNVTQHLDSGVFTINGIEPDEVGDVELGPDEVGLGNVPNVDATARSNHTGTQAQSTVTGLVTDLAAKADLVGGLVPTSQIPAVAKTVMKVCANRAAMLALTDVQEGDGATITAGADKGTYMLDATNDPTVFAHWILMNAPTDVVQTVNGQQGTVVLGPTDVGSQPADPDLSTIAGLDSGSAGVIVSDGAGWIRKTYAQLKTALALVKADVGLGNVDNTSNATERAAVATLTNKRITQRVVAVASSATPVVNSDDTDIAEIASLAVAVTSMSSSLTGTPTNGQKLLFRIKDNGSARAITWGAAFEAVGVALPTTTVASKRMTVGFIYDTTTSKWGCVAVVIEP